MTGPQDGLGLSGGRQVRDFHTSDANRLCLEIKKVWARVPSTRETGLAVLCPHPVWGLGRDGGEDPGFWRGSARGAGLPGPALRTGRSPGLGVAHLPQARAPKPAAQDGLTFLLNQVPGPSQHNCLCWEMLPGAEGCVPSGLLLPSFPA